MLSSRLAKADARVTVADAPEVIGMNEHPARAVRLKPRSSVVAACQMVASGEADAVVSLGNTGATMAASLLRIQRIKGVERPAIAIPMPTTRGVSLVLDAGATVECRPSHLLQFALMGAIYYSSLTGTPFPTVGLLNVGEEPEKGSDLVVEAHRLLASSDLNFIGNVEGRDIPFGKADVVVCDGFVGNVVLKLAEGIGAALFDMIKEEVGRSPLLKLAAGLAKPAFVNVKRRMDDSEYGGAPLLGVNGVTIIGHGHSNAKAVYNALRAAARMHRDGVVDAIAQSIQGNTSEIAEV
jgi:glycerol-3-phosphate acyltransferase PlsX